MADAPVATIATPAVAAVPATIVPAAPVTDTSSAPTPPLAATVTPPAVVTPPAPVPTPPVAPKPGDTPPAVTEPVWPTDGLPPDYRARMAKGLEGDDLRAVNNILERLGSPADIAKKLLNQERQLSQPRKATKPAADAKPEEVAAWRKENGVPDAPDKYDVKLPDGKILGDADKEVLAEFAPALHAAGVSNDQMSAVVSQYLTIVEAEGNKQIEVDADSKVKAEVSLKADWGADYERNLGAIGVIMQDAPKGLSDQLFGGRLADGRKIGDTPEVLKFLSALALQAVPGATLLPTDMPNGPTLLGEIAQIEKDMKADINSYFKDPAKQKRYADLLSAREITEQKIRKA